MLIQQERAHLPGAYVMPGNVIRCNYNGSKRQGEVKEIKRNTKNNRVSLTVLTEEGYRSLQTNKMFGIEILS
jgi:hypothetical protein